MNRGFRKFSAVVFTVMVVVAMPLLLPVAIGLEISRRRRMKSAAKNTCCAHCGVILGVESIRRADKYWKDHLSELQEKYPGVKFRIIRDVYAICSKCGTRFKFLEKEGIFVANEAKSSFEVV